MKSSLSRRIVSFAALALRHTGLHPAMPHAEKVEKIDALLKEFKLPTLATAVVP
jgi:hypothetical protein